ncbi:MAG: hypothetical protein JWP31_2528 [Aeromicrobium sp.]|nr:hypothetical protein [Aeromicrobium sp.]
MPSPFNADLARLIEELHRAHEINIDDAMAKIVDFAMRTLGLSDGGIFLAQAASAGPFVETMAPTSPEVTKIDLLQHELRTGPSFDALGGEDAVLAANLTVEERWPGWREGASGIGIVGVVSARLHARERTIGALNLYTREADRLTAQDAETAHLLAKHAAAALAAAVDHTTLTQSALSRSIIGRAQGVLMERYDITADQAFEVLKRHSQALNVKLRTIATVVAEGGELPSMTSPDSFNTP